VQLAFNLLIIVIAFILQNTIGVYLKVGAVAPDIVLIALVGIAFLENQIQGVSSGFLAGFLKDLSSLRGFGVSTLTHTLIGYVGGGMDSALISNFFLLMAVAAAVSVVSQFLYMGIAFLVGYQIDYLFWRYAILAAFYNALISPFIYLPINAVYLKLASRSQMPGIKDGQKKI